MEMNFCFVVLAVFLGRVFSNEFEFVPVGGVGDLRGGSCSSPSLTSASCCLSMYGHKGCVGVKYEPPSAIRMTVTLDGFDIYTVSFNVKHPDPPCFKFKGNRVCVMLYNVQLQETSFSACIKAEVSVGVVKKDVNLGCFKISTKPVDAFTLLFGLRDQDREVQLLY